MDKLIALVAWPAVALIGVIVFLLLFRNPIATLIARTRRIGIGAGGLEAYETQPSPPSELNKANAELVTNLDSPLLPQAQQLIIKDLHDRNIHAPEEREQALIRALAAANISVWFEQIYTICWASQISCLRYLNSRDGGADTSELRPFYDAAKVTYPAWYANYPYENWLAFLRNVKLVIADGSRYSITVAGREFLKYMITMAKPGPYYG